MRSVLSRRSDFSLAAVPAALVLTRSATRAACDGQDEKNKETARRWMDEVWTAGKVEVLDEIAAEDFTPADPLEAPGREAWKQRTREAVDGFKALIPDVAYAIDDLFAADSKVCLRGRITGTSTGGKKVDAPFINILLFKDGLVASWWPSDVSVAIARAL
jgi:hypothetical protein